MKTKILFITPFPPQASGIADNMYHMLTVLKSAYEIDVLTNAESPRKITGIQVYNDIELVFNQKQYDLIVYEMGNNPDFHAFMIPLLAKYGGIVHLHDLVLQHLMADVLQEEGGWSLYLEKIAFWYGSTVAEHVNDLKQRLNVPFWETEGVALLPLFEEVLQYADGCLVHSNYNLNIIKSRFPDLPVKKVWHFPFTNIVFQKNKMDNAIFHIGIFGGVQRNRQIAVSLEVCEILSKEHNIHLHVVGEIEPALEPIIEKARQRSYVTVYGRVDDNEFESILQKVDICINLRYPTMGETSGVAIRCLQMGIVLIVSDTGWYKELPNFVSKIPLQNMRKQLFDTLEMFLDCHSINRYKIQCRSFVEKEFNENIIKDHYIGAINFLNIVHSNREYRMKRLETILGKYALATKR